MGPRRKAECKGRSIWQSCSSQGGQEATRAPKSERDFSYCPLLPQFLFLPTAYLDMLFPSRHLIARASSIQLAKQVLHRETYSPHLTLSCHILPGISVYSVFHVFFALFCCLTTVRSPIATMSRNVNWCSHCRKQYGSFSKLKLPPA